MGLLAKDKGGTDFTALPAGMHHAVCYAVIDIGTQPSWNPSYPPRRQVVLCFEIPAERIDITKEDGTKQNLPRAISGIYTLSLAAKSKLRPILESWRGRPFSPEELEGFDLKNLLGANCLLNVVHVEGKDKQGKPRTYANIASVNPLTKGMQKVKTENPLTFFSFDENEDGSEMSIPATVPEWLAVKISQSQEWQEGRDDSPPNGGHTHTAKTPEEEESDVPF